MTRWTPGSAWRRAREVLRREGSRSLALRLAGEVGYRRMLVMECSLAVQPARVDPAEGVEFGPLRAADIAEYLRLRPDSDAAEIEARLARDDECVVARRDGHIVQACWAAQSPVWIDYLHRHFELADDQTMLYDFYALPEVRGRNLFRAHISAMFSHWAGHRRQRILAAFHPENRAWALVERVGLRPVGVIGYVGAGPLRHQFSRWDQGAAERLRARAARRRRRSRRLVPFASKARRG
jgi:hypothetical protein